MSTNSLSTTKKIDSLIDQLKSFNILEEEWFQGKNKHQLEKKLIGLKAQERERQRLEEERKRELKS